MAGNRASYYRSRAVEEQAAAETATTIEARRVHLDMAQLYETRARESDRKSGIPIAPGLVVELTPGPA